MKIDNNITDISFSLNNIRYTLTYGDKTMSFSAPMANDNEQLVDLLENLICSIKAQSNAKTVIGECEHCFQFLVKEEKHICKT